jgi:hypothetical protein
VILSFVIMRRLFSPKPRTHFHLSRALASLFLKEFEIQKLMVYLSNFRPIQKIQKYSDHISCLIFFTPRFHAHMYTYTFMHTHLYVCVCSHIHTHMHTQVFELPEVVFARCVIKALNSNNYCSFFKLVSLSLP